jgi:hypothetical protein
MNELIKQFIYTMLTPPKHINELLDFIEKEYSKGKITTNEYIGLLSLFNHFDI